MDLQTLALHAGYQKDTQGTMAVPIYMSTAYEFRDVKHAANLFALKELGNIYTRLNNPTTDVFEKHFAQLEGGEAAIATSSGMSAIANSAEAGDNIICAKQLYGGSLTQTAHTFKRFGIESRYFDVQNPSEIEALIDDKTKVIFFESLTNPSIDVADIEAITAIANKHAILTVVDNTVATPILCRPFEYGAGSSPFNSWLFIQGLEHLSLRMKEHSKNAQALAKFLESHPKVKKVNYPGLKSNSNYKNAQKYFQDGLSSGLLSFEVETLELATKIVNSTEFYSLVVNIGDSKSIIPHPASTTHQQLTDEELNACGVPAGLKSIDDLISDLKQALEA